MSRRLARDGILNRQLARDGLVVAALGAVVYLLSSSTPNPQAEAGVPVAITASAPASAAMPVVAQASGVDGTDVKLSQDAGKQLSAATDSGPAGAVASAAASASVSAATAASAASATRSASLPASAASGTSTGTSSASASASVPSVVANAASAQTPAVAASASSAKHLASAASAPANAASAAVAAASAASAAKVANAVPANPCTAMVKQLPNLTTELCEAAKLQLSGAFSVEGYPLYQRDVSAPLHELPPTEGPRPPRRPRVLVIGAIHGDEISSTSLVFHWIAHALETGADMDWRFIPALNPDGLLQRRPTRTNSRGVDLNRNFPTPNWDKEALQYWFKRTKQDVRRYPGPSALSEPESSFIQKTMERWKPDVIVSIHAPFGVLDYDGPSTPPERLGRLFLDRVGIYPGSLGNYGGVHRGVPVVTIELPSAIRTPTDTEMRQMWIDLLRWIGERLSPVER